MSEEYVPVTPAGTPCTWLSSKTEDEAWERLMEDAAHTPYKTKENFQERGYTVERWVKAKGTTKGTNSEVRSKWK